MRKFRVFNKAYDSDDDPFGRRLCDFLVDPTLHLDRSFYDTPSGGIEACAQRLWAAHASLLELLVSKGQITWDEALLTLDVDSDLSERYELREIKDD